MARLESETVIVINGEDLWAGYFSFGTSKRAHFEKLCRRIGGKDQLLNLRLERSTKGKVRWWQADVPKKFLHANLGIRKPKQLSPANRQRQAERMRALRPNGNKRAAVSLNSPRMGLLAAPEDVASRKVRA